MRGRFAINTRWSFEYLAEYLLAFDSETTNSELAGWKATEVWTVLRSPVTIAGPGDLSLKTLVRALITIEREG